MAKANGQLDPEPAPQPEQDEDYGDLMAAIEKFRQPEYGGFDDLAALALAWNRVSPSDVRERWVKRGATREQITDYFLGIDDAA